MKFLLITLVPPLSPLYLLLRSPGGLFSRHHRRRAHRQVGKLQGFLFFVPIEVYKSIIILLTMRQLILNLLRLHMIKLIRQQRREPVKQFSQSRRNDPGE